MPYINLLCLLLIILFAKLYIIGLYIILSKKFNNKNKYNHQFSDLSDLYL